MMLLKKKKQRTHKNHSLDSVFEQELPVSDNVEEAFQQGRRTAFILSVLILCVAVVAWSWANTQVDKTYANHLDAVSKRMVLTATDNLNQVDKWARQLQSNLGSMAKDPFITSNLSDGEVTQPLLNETLQSWATSMKASRITLLKSNTKPLAHSHPDGKATLANADLAMATEVMATGTSGSLPFRETEEGLMMRLFQAITANGKAHGVLIADVPLPQELVRSIYANPTTPIGEQTELVQLSQDGYQALRPYGTAESTLLSVKEARIGRLFGLRPVLLANRDDVPQAYSLTTPVNAFPWLMVYQAIDKDVAMAPAKAYAMTLYTLVGLGALCFVLLMLAVAARWASIRNRLIAGHYRRLARHSRDQQQVLEAINNTLLDQISLRDIEGRYIYVNPSFEAFWGVDLQKIAGRRDEEVFTGKLSTTQTAGDKRVLKGKPYSVANQAVKVADKQHILRTDKVPVADSGSGIQGILTISRDITEFVTQRTKLNNMRDEMLETLVRAIELRDPHLAGHSLRMSVLASHVAGEMGLSTEEQATLQFAAHLSGIGKVFVPKAILTKPGKLTAKEQAQLREHVAHAQHLLEGREFALPVTEVVCQMYERMDGSGYPEGLKGDKIHPLARVLAVCDVFCALVAPRSYRDGMKVKDALATLKQDADKFDADVLAALTKVLKGKSDTKVKALLDEHAA